MIKRFCDICNEIITESCDYQFEVTNGISPHNGDRMHRKVDICYSCRIKLTIDAVEMTLGKSK